MKRDEMLAVLRQLEEEFYDDANAAHEDGDRHYNDKARRWGEALHKAVKMLTPPTTEEIEWLRQLVAGSRRCVAVKVRGEKDPPWVMRHGLGRALDALAREPGLLAQVAQMEADGREYCKSTDAYMERAIETNDQQADRIVELEARERRVREAVAEVGKAIFRDTKYGQEDSVATQNLVWAKGMLDTVLDTKDPA